jgi:FlaA1/EpsC-like NDP-sugar epimerase
MPPLVHNPATAPPPTDENENLDWSTLLHRTAAPVDPATLAKPFAGKRILITGAAGSIGSALAQWIARFQPEHLILLDSAEHGLYELQNDLASLANAASHTTIPGSVCDAALLREIFSLHRPQIVYHAAAYKHVPLMEHHPLAALENNTLGMYTLAQACIEFNAEQLIMLSTDKAVSPSSIMGASKRSAELILLALRTGTTKMKALRLGNVLGSRGSVVPRFQQQIAQGAPVTVTHPDVRRYFLSLRESVELLLTLARPEYTDGIFIPDIGEPIRILDLARFLIQQASPSASPEIPIQFTGLRPGDKMNEELLSSSESIDAAPNNPSQPPLHRVLGPLPSPEDILHAMQQLQQAIRKRNTESALETLQRIVPEYQPGELIRQNPSHPVNAL